MNAETTGQHEIGTRKWWFCWFCGLVVLIAGGWAYRHYAPDWEGTGQTIINLPVPLTEFPDHLGQWEGMDRKIPEVTISYMRNNFVDDYFNKFYRNSSQNVWANLYVVYCASRPSSIKGHRPDVCYVNTGWVKDGKAEASEFTTLAGQTIPCLIHHFYKPSLKDYAEIVVMNFYVVSGRRTNDESDIDRMVGRNPNTEGDPAKYVAQVQISSEHEHNVRVAAAELVDRVLYYLPDENGVVQAGANLIGTPEQP